METTKDSKLAGYSNIQVTLSLQFSETPQRGRESSEFRCVQYAIIMEAGLFIRTCALR